MLQPTHVLNKDIRSLIYLSINTPKPTKGLDVFQRSPESTGGGHAGPDLGLRPGGGGRRGSGSNEGRRWRGVDTEGRANAGDPGIDHKSGGVEGEEGGRRGKREVDARAGGGCASAPLAAAGVREGGG
jgi:hypothetical protein